MYKMLKTMNLNYFRALVAEALEISTFMEKMRTQNDNEQLNELAMDDWAK